MFDGVPEQFHQFITPPRTSTTSLPLHLPFPLHATTTPNTTFPTFDPYPNNHHHHHQLELQPANLLNPILHYHHKSNEEKEQREVELLPAELIDPWSNDEVLALLRIRSSMETNWLPDHFTWEHVSRKLAEVGYKRSAEKCKDKFEEETRYFNNYGPTPKNNNNYHRCLNDLEQLYQKTTATPPPPPPPPSDQDNIIITSNMDHALEEKEEEDDSRNDEEPVLVEKTNKEKKKKRKRKRSGSSTNRRRFEVFKGFCESVVKKMMEQQEEMHNKLIQDMLKRDEEKFTKEDAWKKQEMEKMNMELDLMAREQAIAGDRHANIIQFLNKFSPTTTSTKLKLITSTLHSQSPNPSTENPSSSLAHDDTLLLPSSTKNYPSSSLNDTNSILISKDDTGRRWPKDEVLALINLRCSTNMNNNNSSCEEKEGNNKVAPLWERISQGMLELGYKRTAKRCKEKWENINKYFRKTKDANRKRSIDSRTCPYFHLLSNLYKQGKLVLQTERSESHLNNTAAEKQSQDAEEAESSQVGPAAGNFTMQQQQDHHGGEKKIVFQQLPSLDFDQF